MNQRAFTYIAICKMPVFGDALLQVYAMWGHWVCIHIAQAYII